MESKDSELSSLLEPILRDRIQERIGVEGDVSEYPSTSQFPDVNDLLLL
jgi:hypothetical protein